MISGIKSRMQTIWLHLSDILIRNFFTLCCTLYVQIYKSCQNSQVTWRKKKVLNLCMQFQDSERKTARQYPVASGAEPQRIWKLGSQHWSCKKEKKNPDRKSFLKTSSHNMILQDYSWKQGEPVQGLRWHQSPNERCQAQLTSPWHGPHRCRKASGLSEHPEWAHRQFLECKI